MLFSLMNNENYNYICLHAEEALNIPSATFCSDYEDIEDFYGIYSKDLTANVLYQINKSNLYDKNLILDFDKIKNVSDNNITELFANIVCQFFAQEKSVYFTNVCEKIFTQMIAVIETYKCLHEFNEEDNNYYILATTKVSKGFILSASESFKMVNDLFDKMLGDMIKKYTEDYIDKFHFSAPVYLSKYINVKKMIENENRFFNLCIYKLAIKMVNQGIFSDEQYDNKNTCLFFHTLNGAYIATQLAMMTKMNMVYLDHLGPIEALHKKHFEKCINDSDDYIIISDVICIGSEIGRAKTIIEYNGGKVKGVACFADIETTKIEKTKADTFGNRSSLYTVSKVNNDIEYTITTELCVNCERGEEKCQKR